MATDYYLLSACVYASLCIPSTKLDLRFSLALCEKEKLYRQKRRDRVMLGIKKLLDMEKPRFLPSSPQEVGTTPFLLSVSVPSSTAPFHSCAELKYVVSPFPLGPKVNLKITIN